LDGETNPVPRLSRQYPVYLFAHKFQYLTGRLCSTARTRNPPHERRVVGFCCSVGQTMPRTCFWSAQVRGNREALRRFAAFRSTGWVPAAIRLTISGARYDSRKDPGEVGSCHAFLFAKIVHRSAVSRLNEIAIPLGLQDQSNEASVGLGLVARGVSPFDDQPLFQTGAFEARGDAQTSVDPC
jgi:hypothetical protein